MNRWKTNRAAAESRAAIITDHDVIAAEAEALATAMAGHSILFNRCHTGRSSQNSSAEKLEISGNTGYACKIRTQNMSSCSHFQWFSYPFQLCGWIYERISNAVHLWHYELAEKFELAAILLPRWRPKIRIARQNGAFRTSRLFVYHEVDAAVGSVGLFASSSLPGAYTCRQVLS